MPVTFQEIMDFKEEHNAAVFDEIKKSIGKLLPFVGAGLTARFYGTWPAAIRSLGKALDTNSQDALEQLLDANLYLEAAQFLERKRGKNNLRQDLIAYFSSSKLTNNWASVNKEAIYLLPLLFGKRPILTTNFDQALEEVYSAHGINLPALGPADDELVTTAKKLMNTACVFKLHGTVTGEMMAYDKLVLTKSQYERHYGSTNPMCQALNRFSEKCFLRKHPVVRTLREFVSSRSLFFLGCSLEKDRTVEILRQAGTSGGPSFAIVSCKPGEQDERVKELGGLNVRAILFEDGKYESVRIVLEKLLEGTNPHAFFQLGYNESTLASGFGFNPYKYDSGLTPLIGRDHEMEDLKDFVLRDEGEVDFRWWALTSAGGSGKSRLAIELIKEINALPRWCCFRLGQKDYRRLHEIINGNDKKTLIVADYVQAHARKLGNFVEELATKRPSIRIRLLLVEREGKLVNGSYAKNEQVSEVNWQRQFFEDIHDKDSVRRTCWNNRFLELKPLSEDSLLEIVDSFARGLYNTGDEQYRKRPIPDETVKGSLIEQLKSIDSHMCRPLYLLFLTGTWMSGEDPTKWNREQVLDNVIDRELSLLDWRIRQVTHSPSCNNHLYSSCQQLYRLSTAILGKSSELIQTRYHTEWDELTKAIDRAGCPDTSEFLSQIGLLKDNQLIPMEPDLMGEYFVYRWLCQEAKDEKKWEAFRTKAWHFELDAAIFFDRLLRDYRHLLRTNTRHWYRLFPPIDDTASIRTPSLRAMILVNITIHCNDYDVSQAAVDQIETLQALFPHDTQTALALVQGLFNLANNQDRESAEETLRRIKGVQSEFGQNSIIAFRLAQSLFNLANKQDDMEAVERIVNQIEDLSSDYRDNPKIALVHARGLVYLSLHQDAVSAEATVNRIDALRKRFSGDSEIAQALARGLANLSFDQDVEKAEETVNRISVLASEFPDDRSIASELTKGLVNLTSKQDAESAVETIRQLEDLRKNMGQDLESTFALARGLVNLTHKQSAMPAYETIRRIEYLQETLPDDRDLALILVEGLLILVQKVAKQNANRARTATSHILRLEKRFPHITNDAFERLDLDMISDDSFLFPYFVYNGMYTEESNQNHVS